MFLDIFRNSARRKLKKNLTKKQNKKKSYFVIFCLGKELAGRKRNYFSKLKSHFLLFFMNKKFKIIF